MTTIDLANAMRRLGVGAAIACTFLSLAVFVVLLVVQHDPLVHAAQAAMPLAVFALFGAFGAGMTRYMVR